MATYQRHLSIFHVALLLTLAATSHASARVRPGPDVTATTQPDTVVRIDEDRALKSFTPRFLGYNYEWASQLYLFLKPGTSEIDPEVAEVAGDLPLPLNRASGTVSQELSWKGAVGPLDRRTVQRLADWLPEQKVAFGPVEWFRWVLGNEPSAKFTWTLNLRKDSPEDAADLVEFLTGDPARDRNGGANWAKKRVEYGLERPVSVVAWEIGNEMDQAEYRWTREQYVAAARPVVDAIRSVDPSAKIAIQGSSHYDRNWNRAVLAGLGAKADYVTAHYYYQGEAPPEIAEGFSGHRYSQVERSMEELREDIRQVTGDDRIKVYVSEYAFWPWRAKGSEWKRNWWMSDSLDACLANARMITRFLNRPEIDAAAYHCFSGGPWRLLGRDESTRGVSDNGMTELFRMLGRIATGDVVSVETTGPATDVSAEECRLFAAAVRNGAQLQTLLVNRGEARAISLRSEQPHRFKEAWMLTGPDLRAYNTPAQRPIAVSPLALPAGRAAGKETRVTVPARSVVLVTMERAGGAGDTQATAKPSRQGDHVRRVCFEGVDMHLGDPYDTVARLFDLRPDPSGGERDFVAAPGAAFSVGGGSGKLHPAISFTFDNRRRLESAAIDWTYDGERTSDTRELVFGVIKAKLGSCLELESARLDEGRYRRRIDYGTYSEELEFDASDMESWRMRYEIRRQP